MAQSATDFVTEISERFYVPLEEIRKLHHFGLLDALINPRRTKEFSALTSQLGQAFPEQIPTPDQRGIYRLAFAVCDEKINFANLFGNRIYSQWTYRDQQFLDASPEVRERCRQRSPEAYQRHLQLEEDYRAGKLKPEPRPCLINRLTEISDDQAAATFRDVMAQLTAFEYSIIKAHYAYMLTLTKIARNHHCALSTISEHHTHAIEKLSLIKDTFSAQVFGPEELGSLS